MKVNKIVNFAKVVFIAVYVVPPVIDGAVIIAKTTGKIINDQLKKSEIIKSLKKDFELRRQGVVTVKYQDIDK